MTYLVALAAVMFLALANARARGLALILSANWLGTFFAQDLIHYEWMPWVDALTFLAMTWVVMCDEKPSWLAFAATGLMGLSVMVHLAYFSLGSDRFDFSRIHMYALQAVFFLSVAALAVGDTDVFQRIGSLLARVRGFHFYAPRLDWSRGRALQKVQKEIA